MGKLDNSRKNRGGFSAESDLQALREAGIAVTLV